jgi:hypothetical protein
VLLRTWQDQLQQATKIDNKVCIYTSGNKSRQIQELEWEPYESSARRWNCAAAILAAS